MSFTRHLLLSVMIWMLTIPALSPAASSEEPAPAMPDAGAVFTDRSRDVVDGVLEDELANAPPDRVMEALVQFEGGVTPVDEAFLDELGLEVLYRYHIVDGVWLRGPAGAIERLSHYEGVFWMEYNERLTFYMDRSLSTINASKTWASPVLDQTGTLVSEGIDGAGVTAVVLDSGIDAGHPDLDYGEKTILNLKSDTGNPPWYEIENGDTSSGHGTHCAGTVGGNGDASAGGRRGVAPGASLIGLSTGEAFFITGATGALEWVYDNSRPYDNPYNIRVVSNSWGAGGSEYHPEDAISIAIEKLAYENNVVSIFAAGNSGGDGTDIQSSNYGNTPAAVCVAALERDGSGVAVFSSRGISTLNQTFPDIGAPGVKIWSTAARRTLISAMTKQSNPAGIDPYYFAISGTSMATPHVAGLAAPLWQAYPGLKVSDTREHYEPGGQYEDDGWWNASNTRIHEVEEILELSSRYILANGENGVPGNDTRVGMQGRTYDFAQGYGLTMADRAVALALTLKELRTRDFDGDGGADFPDATVQDAYQQYHNIMKTESVGGDTNVLFTQWRGEWSRFNNQSNQAIPFEHDQSHLIFIPPEAELMTLELTYEPVSTTDRSLASLNLIIDYDLDGQPDWSQNPGTIDGNVRSDIDLTTSGFAEARGSLWSFNIEGRGFNIPLGDLRQGDQYIEVRVEYAASMSLYFSHGNGSVTMDVKHMAPYVGQLRFGEPTVDYAPDQGQIFKTTFVYDLQEVKPINYEEGISGVDPVEPWGAVLACILAMAVLYVANYYRKHRRLPDPLKAFARA